VQGRGQGARRILHPSSVAVLQRVVANRRGASGRIAVVRTTIGSTSRRTRTGTARTTGLAFPARSGRASSTERA
jgi:hypothetical protein